MHIMAKTGTLVPRHTYTQAHINANTYTHNAYRDMHACRHADMACVRTKKGNHTEFEYLRQPSRKALSMPIQL